MIPSLSMQEWLIGYLLLGVAVVVILRIVGKSRKKEWAEELHDTLVQERRAKHSKTERLIQDYLLPVLLVYPICVLGWPLLLMYKFWTMYRLKYPAKPPLVREKWIREIIEEKMRFQLQTNELVQRLSIEEIEATNFIEDPMEAVPRVPFGHLNFAWETFKKKMLDTDELWLFRTKRLSDDQAVEAVIGYAIVREGVPVERFVTSDELVELKD